VRVAHDPVTSTVLSRFEAESDMRNKLLLCVTMTTAAPGMVAADAAVYTEDFQGNPVGEWTVNGGPSDETANFFFDYSTVGIPLAPNSAAGGFRGLKLQANQTSGIFGGFSVSPTGKIFVGDYDLAFDWWANANGPFPAGGSGSVMLSTFGVGTSGTLAQWAGGTQDSVWFGATGDGNSAADWRAYSTAAPTSYLDNSGIYAAGTQAGSRNAADPYYAGFGVVAPPPRSSPSSRSRPEPPSSAAPAWSGIA
jgi:hypothetical protein